MGLAERILAAIDLPAVDVGEIPEWGIKKGELFQRGMTGQERRDFEALFVRDETGERPKDDPRAAAVGRTLVDAGGNRVFTEEQLVALAGKSALVLDRLYDQAMRLSGIRSTAAEAEADRKNSATPPGSDSSSA